jgi:hypothetical protein
MKTSNVRIPVDVTNFYASLETSLIVERITLRVNFDFFTESTNVLAAPNLREAR